MGKVTAIYGFVAVSLLIAMAGLLVAFWGGMPPAFSLGRVQVSRYVLLVPVLLGAAIILAAAALWKRRRAGEGQPDSHRVILAFGAAHGQVLLIVAFLWLLWAARGGGDAPAGPLMVGVLLFLSAFFAIIFYRLIRNMK